MLRYYSNPNFYTRLFIGGMIGFIFLNYLVLIFTYQKNPSIELSPYLWGRTKKNSRTIQVRNLVDWLFICLQYNKIKNVLWSTIKSKRHFKNRYMYHSSEIKTFLLDEMIQWNTSKSNHEKSANHELDFLRYIIIQVLYKVNFI